MAAIDSASQLEPTLRPILEELAALTGFESVYVTRIHWREHEQEILLAANRAPTRLYIPEEVQLDYSDAVCRYVIEGGPERTDDVPRVFPQSDMARFLGFQSFISAPIELDGGGPIFGTLCAASTRRVKLSEAQAAEVRRRARLIAQLLSRGEARIPTRS
jgi:diguanylate cyclase